MMRLESPNGETAEELQKDDGEIFLIDFVS